MSPTNESRRLPDMVTVASIGIVAYAISNVAHEAVGHAGACLLVGCQPHLLTAMQFDGDASHLPVAANRLIAAAGTLVNLALATLAFALFRRLPPPRGASWLFLWLLVSISLFQGTGYLLFSGVASVGDWTQVIEGLPAHGVFRIAMALAGGLAYWLSVRWSMKTLAAHLNERGDALAAEAYRYTLVAYLAGAALYIAGGSRDPGGVEILIISAIAASLGGTSGLAWGPQLLKDPKFAPSSASKLVVERGVAWMVAAVISIAVYVFVLGPGIRF